MTTIYDKHDTAFNSISAYVLAHTTPHGIERIATIAFKRGASGNVRCFFHHIGYTMQEGNAGGGGYDKPSAAFYEAAIKNLENVAAQPESVLNPEALDVVHARLIQQAATAGNGSSHWYNALRDVGFALLQAV